VRIGVIGDGRIGARLETVLDRLETPPTELVGWAPARPGAQPPAWAARRGVPARETWQELVADVEGVVLDLAADGHWHQREVVSEAVLEAGKALLVDAPLADFPAVYERIRGAGRRGGGRVKSVRAVRASAGVRDGLATVADGGVGEVLAVYASLHLPVGEAEASFGQHVADLLQVALDAAGAVVPARLYAAGTPAGEAFEAVHAIARMPAGAIVTLEVARCLPQALGLASECTVEVTGSAGLVRLAPEQSAVTVVGTVASRPIWREDTVAAALEDWLSGGADSEAEASADLALMAAMRMVKRSRAKGVVVGPDAEPVEGGA